MTEMPAPDQRTQAFELGYNPALDGLRALAVLSVMFAHVSLIGAGADLSGIGSTPGLPGLRGGFLGVDVFFVLSGFLITALLLKEHRQTGRVRLGAFYGRRALRLLPALLLLLGACRLYATWPLAADNVWFVKRAIPLALGCSVNTYFVVKGIHGGMLTHMWSLNLEEKFYFVWPVLLCVLLGRKVRRRWVCLGVLAAASGSAVLRLACWDSGPPWCARVAISSLPARADNLLIGTLLALLAGWGGLPAGPAGRALWRGAPWAGLALLAALVWQCSAGPTVYVLAGLATALLVGGLAVGRPGPLHALLGARPLVWTGRISYGLYLWHVPIFCVVPLALFRSFGRGRSSAWVALAVSFGVSFAVAAASHHLVERPFLRWKVRLARAGRGFQ